MRARLAIVFILSLTTAACGGDPAIGALSDVVEACLDGASCSPQEGALHYWEDLSLSVQATHGGDHREVESTLDIYLQGRHSAPCPTRPQAQAYLAGVELPAQDRQQPWRPETDCSLFLSWELPEAEWPELSATGNEVRITDGETELEATITDIAEPRSWTPQAESVRVGDTLSFTFSHDEVIHRPVAGRIYLDCAGSESCQQLEPSYRYAAGELAVEIPSDAPVGPVTVGFHTRLDRPAECSVDCQSRVYVASAFSIELLPAQE